MAPDLQFSPQLCIGVINIANCSDDVLELHPSSILLTLTFSSEQILGIKKELECILNNQQLDRNIVNYQFLKSTAQTISKIATQAYIKDLTSYRAFTKKNKKKAKDHETQDGTENIFSLEEINKSIVLQSTTLLNGLLKKGFTCKTFVFC